MPVTNRITKRFGVYTEAPSTIHIKVQKQADGKYEATAKGTDYRAVSDDENRATRMLKEEMERDIRSGK